MSTFAQAPVERAREALTTARTTRSRYLVEVSMGTKRPLDVILAAHHQELAALRQIRLNTLLTSQPGVGRSRAKAHLTQLLERSGSKEEMLSLSIGWLIDPRAGGRRLLTWFDVTHPGGAPWPGFPYAQPPATESWNGR